MNPIDERDIKTKGTGVTVPLYSGPGTPSVGEMTVADMHTGVHSVGVPVKNGQGDVTKNGAFTIDVVAGSVLIRQTDDKGAILEYVEFDALVNFDLSTSFSGETAIHVYLDYANGATIQFSTTDPDPTHEVQTIQTLAEIHISNDVIIRVDNTKHFVGNHPQEFSILHHEVLGVIVGGMVITEPSALKLAIEAGRFFVDGFNNIDIPAFDTSVADTFTYWYKGLKTGTYSSVGTAVTGVGTAFTTEFEKGDDIWDSGTGEMQRIESITDDDNLVLESAFSIDVGAGEPVIGWAKVTGQTDYDNTQYDDDSGTLQTLGAGKYKKDFIYMSRAGTVDIMYSQGLGNSEQDAIDQLFPTYLPLLLEEHAHAYIIGTWHSIVSAANVTIRDVANRFEKNQGFLG